MHCIAVVSLTTAVNRLVTTGGRKRAANPQPVVQVRCNQDTSHIYSVLCAPSLLVKRQNAAQALAGVQELERLVDLAELHLVGYVLVQQRAAGHVLIHEAGHVPAALVAPERCPFPRPSRHQLERARLHTVGVFSCRCVVLLAYVGGLILLDCACAFDSFLL